MAARIPVLRAADENWLWYSIGARLTTHICQRQADVGANAGNLRATKPTETETETETLFPNTIAKLL
jgi:hypothetical protein